MTEAGDIGIGSVDSSGKSERKNAHSGNTSCEELCGEVIAADVQSCSSSMDVAHDASPKNAGKTTDFTVPTKHDANTSSVSCQTDLIWHSQYEREPNECLSDDVASDDDADFIPSEESTSQSCSDDESAFDIASLQRIRSLCKRHSRRYIGVPEDSLFVVDMLAERVASTRKQISKLEPRDVVLLILMKIRLHRQFSFLADDFGIHRTYAGRLFTEYVGVVAQALGDLIVWPDAEVIKKHVPLAFKARFSNVTCIIDCLEIEIEKPESAVKQAQTWSSYKSANTIKYLISILPNGLINFVSQGYGGRITDMNIVRRSGFLEHLCPGMVVMADRGFKGIGPILADVGCRLVRPSSVNKGCTPSKQEVRSSKQVASLRIHVERAIRRVREFAMLKPHAVIGTQLIGLADDCMTAACGLINLQPPLTKV